MSKIFIIFNISLLLYSLIIISLLLNINCQETKESEIITSSLYPSTLTLLNQDLIMVTNDGIHYYSPKMIEDVSKKIIFENPIVSQDENKMTSMAQFSEDDGGYIMILVKNRIYFLEYNGTKIYDLDLNNSTDSSSHYCIIPYKKEGNILNYFISYGISDGKSFKINHFKFNIITKVNEKNITKTKEAKNIGGMGNNPNGFVGVDCIIMIPSSLNLNILVCFYSINYPPEIQASSFDPLNNLDELTNYFKYYTYEDTSLQAPSFISGITNEEKQKALIYFVNGYPYKMTFDFDNGFSSPFMIVNNGNFQKDLSQHKIFYFRETHEYIFASSLYSNFCRIYLICFNSDFSLKNKVLLDPGSECSLSESFSVYFDGEFYSLVVDNTFHNQIKIQKAVELGTNEKVEDSSTQNNMAEEDNNNNIESYAISYSIKNEDNKNTNKINDSETNENNRVTNINNDSDTYSESYSFIENDEKNKINNNNIKCKSSNSKSLSYNLCIECNTDRGYFPAEIKDKSIFHGFTECYNNDTKPINFYFDDSDNTYKICYETCLTCNKKGNEYTNNCIECDINYIKKPGYEYTTNCVTNCLYLYYYTSYGQYKCTVNYNCPDEANFYIEELKKCTFDCRKEVTYRYQYGGKCLKNCPKNTESNPYNICIENINNCLKSENKMKLNELLSLAVIDFNAKNYAKEFGYTSNHISYFYNNLYQIILYKESKCIEELFFNLPIINFDVCYTKIQEKINSTDKIIIALIKKLNVGQKITISYLFYHPETGERLDAETICKDEEVIIRENIIIQLNNSNIDLNSALFLTQQDINIFNISDAFYTDICYFFKSPNGKDIPLKERIHIYYPNISLCDTGCNIKGINLTSMESICECKFNYILNNELVEGNALISNAIGDITDILSNSNLDVLKCFKDVFKKQNILKGTGGFIILGIFVIEIIFSLIFLFYDIIQIRNYLYNLSENYIYFIDKKYKDIKIKKNFIEVNKKIKNPPKLKVKRKKKRKKKNNQNNNEINSKSYISQKSIIILNHDKSNSNSKNFYFKKDNNLLKNSNIFIQKNNKKITENIDKINEIDEYLKTDLDEMDFDDAIKNDKRTFCIFFCERLKEKQMIIDTFCNKNNIKPLSIKILLFLLNIDLYFVNNGLFYSEDYIIELYHLEDEDTFFSFFPRSINRFFYATMVGELIELIIDCLFIEEKKIKRIFIREKEDSFQLRYEIAIIIKKIKKKYIIFIYICFFISIFSWYYVSTFNNVYSSVKIEWIKSSITLISIMQILSVVFVFIEGIIRVLSFKCKSEKVYKLKQLLY